ncbi:UDP-N-acetylmuramate--L-alanine ligase [Sanguibacter antarcticus]|uniref:UDP-N-acetylmuramate--L-alanine ligase n=1 Tax=Sanguibacter antarcticus TaxID=372484 RepID=A0A2A9E4I4_9MICO|nr:UDP-N-acetylmuramate--L-alanine ligase [Sanguibacter antarcticus]PFG33461.1 UDP-N-acetylmuramate--L-alanine ligase [Sanguibacter antarcticus]
MSSEQTTGGPQVSLPVADLGTVHLIGVGGAGMSVVARLLVSEGAHVQGSDARRSAVTDALGEAGVRVWIGHEASNVADAQTVVVSSAVRADNPELVAARAAGLRVLHRSQALAVLMAGRRSVAVAGAHGKTTTSAMIAVALTAAGLEPSFAIGGSVLTADGALPGGHLGAGDVLVAEADESDGSFLAYRPFVSVVTNVEPDHLDHYGSREAFEEAFRTFAGNIDPAGYLVACVDDAGARSLVSHHVAAGGRALTYGTADGATAVLAGYAVVPETGGCRFTLVVAPGTPVSRDGVVLDVDLRVSGMHNALNASAAVLVALALEVPPDAAAAGVGEFMGTGRRFELRGVARGVRVVDDYAHHPTEVAAMLVAARGVAAGGRIIVLFQPHLYSRTRIFAHEFADALELADVVVVTDVYGAREDPDPSVGAHTIVDRMSTPGRGRVVRDRLEAARTVAELAQPGDLVITVGAGDVTELGGVVLTTIDARAADEASAVRGS